jgi:hypothetical protein
MWIHTNSRDKNVRGDVNGDAAAAHAADARRNLDLAVRLIVLVHVPGEAMVHCGRRYGVGKRCQRTGNVECQRRSRGRMTQ